MTAPSDKLRELCLTLPEAHEVEAWGEPTFRVKNKIFAMYASPGNHHGGGRPALWCKAAPGEQALLVKAEPARFFVPPYVGPSGWVGVWLDRRPRWKHVEELIRDSYRLTAPHKLQALLLTMVLLICVAPLGGAQQLGGGIYVSSLAVGGGTYSVDRVTAHGVGARVMFTPTPARGYASVAALYSTFPRDAGDTPSISAGGVEVTVLANPRGTLRPYLGVGVGFIRFAPERDEFAPCDPALGCIAEGAPQFRRQTATTLRPVLGLAVAASSQLSLFGDLRLHLRRDTPWNGSHFQPEGNIGFAYRPLF